MVARLPTQHYETLIRDMAIGNLGWATPWAMTVMANGTSYLNGRYSIHKSSGGTVQMRIERQADGYYVCLVKGECYSHSDSIPWMGADVDDLIPIQEFIS